MGDRFRQELAQLQKLILQMATLAEGALEKAVTSLLNRNANLVQEVLSGDREIDLLEIAVDKLCQKLLALEQPMAKDLRFIVGCMHIGVELERVGDLAANTARCARYLSNHPPLPPNPALEQLVDVTLDMMKVASSAFANQNASQANDVCLMDDTADELNIQSLKDLLKYMINEVSAVKRAMQAIIAARNLERIADHATNMAEWVIFIAMGENVKHHCHQ